MACSGFVYVAPQQLLNMPHCTSLQSLLLSLLCLQYFIIIRKLTSFKIDILVHSRQDYTEVLGDADLLLKVWQYIAAVDAKRGTKPRLHPQAETELASTRKSAVTLAVQ